MVVSMANSFLAAALIAETSGYRQCTKIFLYFRTEKISLNKTGFPVVLELSDRLTVKKGVWNWLCLWKDFAVGFLLGRYS